MCHLSVIFLFLSDVCVFCHSFLLPEFIFRPFHFSSILVLFISSISVCLSEYFFICCFFLPHLGVFCCCCYIQNVFQCFLLSVLHLLCILPFRLGLLSFFLHPLCLALGLLSFFLSSLSSWIVFFSFILSSSFSLRMVFLSPFISFFLHFLMHPYARATDLRAFGCSLCDKAFKQKQHLDRHLQCHSGELPAVVHTLKPVYGSHPITRSTHQPPCGKGQRPFFIFRILVFLEILIACLERSCHPFEYSL